MIFEKKIYPQELYADNNSLKEKLNNLEDKQRQHDYRLLAINNDSRANHVLIHGAPIVNTAEEAINIMQNLADKLQVPFEESIISFCHPLPTRKGSSIILCKFIRNWQKQDFMTELRKAKLTTGQMGWGESSRPVYATDHWAPETMALLAKAKEKLQLKNGGPCQYIWIRAGKVLVRVGESGATREIRWPEDIDRQLALLANK